MPSSICCEIGVKYAWLLHISWNTDGHIIHRRLHMCVSHSCKHNSKNICNGQLFILSLCAQFIASRFMALKLIICNFIWTFFGECAQCKSAQNDTAKRHLNLVNSSNDVNLHCLSAFRRAGMCAVATVTGSYAEVFTKPPIINAYLTWVRFSSSYRMSRRIDYIIAWNICAECCLSHLGGVLFFFLPLDGFLYKRTKMRERCLAAY